MSDQIGFALYLHKAHRERESILTDREAMRVLSWSTFQENDKRDSFLDLSLLCLKWKAALDKQLNENPTNKEQIIDLFQSGRRHYEIRGIILSNFSSVLKEQEKNCVQYLFMLERRVSGMKMDLTKPFRDLKLTKREREVVELLIKDRSNKEIAYCLGISINTVKGYIKLLMKKLSVSSRTGIISHFLSH